jgi:dTDP-glucose 4,6-dehydratase
VREFNSILVTGGAGFIGCNFIQYMLDRNSEFDGKIVNFDKLTYAGNLSSLKSIAEKHEGQRYYFEKGDINNITELSKVLKKYNIDAVVHFAAESHVDRSINGPETFIKTNVVGTFRILEACKNFWKNRKDVHFHHVSTDEVYGSLGEEGFFTEHTPYDPRSPYSASKASSNHIVNAFYHTYGLPITISNCSNNYGPFQFPEKLIPLMILNILDNKTITRLWRR